MHGQVSISTFQNQPHLHPNQASGICLPLVPVVGDFYNWLCCGMFGATDNLFDLRDRESDDDREVLDTGGLITLKLYTIIVYSWGVDPTRNVNYKRKRRL